MSLIRVYVACHGIQCRPRIRLLLQEQSDQGLHCLTFRLHLLGALLALLYGKIKLLQFKINYCTFSGRSKFFISAIRKSC